MMNPKTQLVELLLGDGLTKMFNVVEYVGATKYPKLLEEHELNEEDFRDKVFDIVSLATMIQADADELIIFDEALELASKELLSSVQLLGLREALMETDSALTPELIATYALSSGVTMRPPRFTVECIPQEHEDLQPSLVTALAILLPDQFDVIALDGEDQEAFVRRAYDAMVTTSMGIKAVLGLNR